MCACSVSLVTQSCPTLCDPITVARQASLSTTNSRSLLKHMSIELVMPSNHLILCHPLLLPPSIFPSIRVFSVISNSFATPWTVAHQAPLSMGFSRQEYLSGLPFPPPGIFPSRDRTHISCIDKWILYHCATWEAPCSFIVLLFHVYKQDAAIKRQYVIF